jgi:hypothetical protein
VSVIIYTDVDICINILEFWNLEKRFIQGTCGYDKRTTGLTSLLGRLKSAYRVSYNPHTNFGSTVQGGEYVDGVIPPLFRRW